MKKKYKIMFFITGFIVLSMVVVLSIIGKKGIGQIIDKLGLSKDIYQIEIDKEFSMDTYIYWYGETVNGPKDNKMLFYHRAKVVDIPPLYGYNGFEIKYGKLNYDKIKFWKIFPYSKYKYYICIKSFDEDMVVEWRISNWYDQDVVQGSDTLKIE